MENGAIESVVSLEGMGSEGVDLHHVVDLATGPFHQVIDPPEITLGLFVRNDADPGGVFES
jgi:hypothetical protein